jgi:hypothetical protein
MAWRWSRLIHAPWEHCLQGFHEVDHRRTFVLVHLHHGGVPLRCASISLSTPVSVLDGDGIGYPPEWQSALDAVFEVARHQGNDQPENDEHSDD